MMSGRFGLMGSQPWGLSSRPWARSGSTKKRSKEHKVDDKDVRIDETKHGTGRATHLPTGIFVMYSIAWNDQSDKKNALRDLRGMVTKATSK